MHILCVRIFLLEDCKQINLATNDECSTSCYSMLPPIFSVSFVLDHPKETTTHLQCVFSAVNNIICTMDSITWQIFYGPFSIVNPIGTPMYNPRVVMEISDSVYCHLEVHCSRVETFAANGNEAHLSTLILSLRPGSGYVLCPGIPHSFTAFDSKNLRKWAAPLTRFDHYECLMWYAPVGGLTAGELSRMCPKCTRLSYHMQDMLRRKQALTPRTLKARTLAGSRYPTRYLTPTSRAQKEKNVKRQILANKKTVKRLKIYDVDVSQLTHDDLITLVAVIEKTSKKNLENLFAEADIAGDYLIYIVPV